MQQLWYGGGQQTHATHPATPNSLNTCNRCFTAAWKAPLSPEHSKAKLPQQQQLQQPEATRLLLTAQAAAAQSSAQLLQPRLQS